jgi:hypothetical protein
MTDPRNSMIVLRHEQDAKDLALIRFVKKGVIWFLKSGPAVYAQFFYHHSRREFLKEDLVVKIRSLKYHLDCCIAIISEDCADPVFIEEVL